MQFSAGKFSLFDQNVILSSPFSNRYVKWQCHARNCDALMEVRRLSVRLSLEQ